MRFDLPELMAERKLKWERAFRACFWMAMGMLLALAFFRGFLEIIASKLIDERVRIECLRR
jgi:hypothetical protein